MDPNQIQEALSKKRQEYGQRSAEIPKIYGQYSPESDMTINALRSQQADKIKQLFEHDTNVATTTYQPQEPPGPQPEGYIPPGPRVLDPMSGILAASAQKQHTAGEAGDTIVQIGARKDLLSAERDKALSILDRALRVNEKEIDDLKDQWNTVRQEKKDKVTTLLNVLGETGGDITSDLANILGIPELAGKHILSPSEKYSTSGAGRTEAQALGRLRADIQSGGRFDDLSIRYSSELPISQIRQEYNQGPMARRWGPAKETDEYILERLSRAKKGPSKQELANTEMANIINTLNSFSEKRKLLGTRAFNPYDPLTTEVNTQKDLFSQILGKYIEVGGRGLTDKDREFYAKQIPGAVYLTGSAEGKIKGVKNSILSKSGFYEVKNKVTGQIGIIPKEEFDKNSYIKLAP